MAIDHDGWSRRRFLGTAASGLVLTGLAGCGLGQASVPDRKTTDPENGWAGELVDPGIKRPDVTFTDVHGKPFPFREKTNGKLALLFFGYTNCPDVCPVYLATVARAIESFGTGPGSDTMVLFVGTDVARDTPEQMKKYLDRINPAFIGLTGSEKVIAAANKQVFNPPIGVEEPDADGEYAVLHSSRVFAFMGDGLAHRTYNATTVRQQQWARDLPLLAEGEYR